jgi:flotillin
MVVMLFAALRASRFVKVGPNQVLIVSGRRARLPDGRFVGYRIVKGGGTFVMPVIERADGLSLEVITVEMQGSKGQTAGGHAVQADCFAQVKINSDDVSLLAAMERFLSKSHFIPGDPNLWKPENCMGFLEERRELLAKAMNRLLRSPS